jgi:hypothetical protein
LGRRLKQAPENGQSRAQQQAVGVAVRIDQKSVHCAFSLRQMGGVDPIHFASSVSCRATPSTGLDLRDDPDVEWSSSEAPAKPAIVAKGSSADSLRAEQNNTEQRVRTMKT